MSRLLLACSLLAALSSTAIADHAQPAFARPPAGWNAKHDAVRDIAPAPRIHRVLDRDTVRAKLTAARAANLAHFRAYRAKGVFPSNTYTDGQLNVWLDAAGNLCAAATIINASGQADLVAQVAREQNFIRLADVTSGPLMDWILTSGFTQAEIVAIQEPFSSARVQGEPGQEPRVAAGRRRAEDLRLIRKYREVDAMLVRDEKASLELAVDRLMARPRLAWKLIDG